MPSMVNWVWARVGLNRYHKRNTHFYFNETLWFLQEPILAGALRKVAQKIGEALP